ncbi:MULTISPECIES: chemotaxis protein CheX [Aminobacterium]|jgi:chemotaxis protein CheX|uniref:chemotaxis protein CheX n=1 Tax=Aminobacterium TaxID=81466 RepID=UPI00257CEBE2|nr:MULTISPECIES: chemotaxis protein CheX [unclassified Aminobacterium]
MGVEKLATLVNTFGSSLISVSREMGVEVALQRSEVAQGVHVGGSSVAALVGVLGQGLQGTLVIMLDNAGFSAVVTAMSGGMIKPDIEDPVATSVIGELSNMVSGRALTQSSLEGVDVTPPQLITGAGIRTVPSESPGIKNFTLPFSVAQGGTLYLVLSFHC